MKPHIILSHGLDSSPAATKVTALAAVAAQLGFSHERPDYSDIDADGRVEDIDRRIARLHESACAATGTLLLGVSRGQNSVVEGKGGAGRVNPGGRRDVRKKK